MLFFLLRSLPALVAVLAFGAATWQWRYPLSYPWPLVIALAVYGLAALAIGVRRLPWVELLGKIAPSIILLISIIFSFVVASTVLERWFFSLIFTVVAYFGLELLFLLSHARARYPVNGLSRLNLSFVLLAAFFFALTFAGRMVFVHTPWWVVLTAFPVCGFVWMLSTSHPQAQRAEHWRWAVLGGGLLALQIAIFLLLVPISIAVQGALAALFLFIPLRLRRYGHAPVPSRRLALSEGITATVALIAIIVQARWV